MLLLRPDAFKKGKLSVIITQGYALRLAHQFHLLLEKDEKDKQREQVCNLIHFIGI